MRKEKGMRNYLAWLGAMRLMNHYPYTSIEKLCPAAWKKHRSADWPRARQRANEVFRSLFHFLPAGEFPIHWPTAGGRSK